MRILNITDRPARVCGLSIPPGRTGRVDDADYKAWLARSPANRATVGRLRVSPDPAPPANEDEAAVVALIKSAPGFAMTRDGKIRCDELSAALGWRVSAAVRDRAVAWLHYALTGE